MKVWHNRAEDAANDFPEARPEKSRIYRTPSGILNSGNSGANAELIWMSAAMPGQLIVSLLHLIHDDIRLTADLDIGIDVNGLLFGVAS